MFIWLFYTFIFPSRICMDYLRIMNFLWIMYDLLNFE